jgi:hypothetical protein
MRGRGRRPARICAGPQGVPVSPHTFYAYLLVVLHGLRGLEVEARAREILDGLGALRQQFDAFWTAHDKVGTHLANAARQYEESVRLRGRVEDGFAGGIGSPEACSECTRGLPPRSLLRGRPRSAVAPACCPLARLVRLSAAAAQTPVTTTRRARRPRKSEIDRSAQATRRRPSRWSTTSARRAEDDDGGLS